MKASKLKENDLIGVCAPSGIVKKEHKIYFKRSEKILNEYKLIPIYSKNLYSDTLKYSATNDEKSSDLNEFIKNKKIKAIIFAKGGSNSNGILPLIDYDAIKDNPKIFIGFSDNVILLNAIYKKTGLITYHFTNYKGFCESNLMFNKKQFENAFIYGKNGVVSKNSTWKSLRKGIAFGRLIGGNLGSIVKIINTEYFPSPKNKILFIEELALEDDLEDVSSYLYQLKYSKIFEKISGLLIGSYGLDENNSFEKVIMEIVKEYDFPVVKCDDFGHTETNIVLPIGMKCILDGNNSCLVYEENLTK